MKLIACNVCGTPSQAFLNLDAVPPLQNCFCSSIEQAKQFPLTNVTYIWCAECQHISIAKGESIKFDSQYNNDQTSSNVALAHYQHVASEIKSVMPDREAMIVEIGCGRGELLSLLSQSGYFNLQGYDPSAPEDINKFVQNKYWVAPAIPEIDMLVLRHTLEEIPELDMFMRDIATSLTKYGYIYCEITNASRIMRNQDIFSLYPECSNLFTASSLTRLFSKHGISVERIDGYHDGEWLGVWGKKFNNSHPLFDGQALLDQVIKKINELPKPVTLWGAGGRGGNILSFCHANLSMIPSVVDLNKVKQGSFIPPFGQTINAPDQLINNMPGTILVSSNKYKEEILAMAPPGCLVLSIDELIITNEH